MSSTPDTDGVRLARTPLYDLHLELGARMVAFAGYHMPVQYADGILQEHQHTRSAAGLFDVSHMGEFVLRGPQALDLVQRISVNDASRIESGQAQYTAMCLESGGVVDDLLVYRFVDRYMLVVNAANLPKDWAWVSGHAHGFEVELEDASDDIALLALQGPKAREVLAPLEGRGRVVMRGDDLLGQMLEAARPGDHVVFMSNGGFESIPTRFCQALNGNEHD